MIEGYSKVVNGIIQDRLDIIMTSEEFALAMEGVYHGLEQRLTSSIKDLGEREKHELIEDLRNHVFEHMEEQSKLIYRTAFKDGFSFFIDKLLPNK